MTVKEIYKELQMIEEFHADFNPNDKSRERMRELIALLPISKYDRVR